MSTRWRIQLLGELRAAPVQEGRVVTRFRTQKTGALLAYLAYHLQRSHPRDVLIELLWPEGDPDAGRHSLSQALSSLRHQLEPPGLAAGSVILADRASVRLNPGAVTTDIAEFETALRVAAAGAGERQAPLMQAVELYRGAFLPGYYEDWILTEREWLADRYLTALSQLLALLEEGGDLHRALEYAQRGVRADPLREEAHAALMRLHAAAGRPALALRQYRELERLLKNELDEAPTERTRALAEHLRRPEGAAVMDGFTEKRAPPRSGAVPGTAGEADPEPVGRRSGEAPSQGAVPLERGVSRPRRYRHGVSPPTGTVTFLLTSAEESVLPMPHTPEARQAARVRRDEVMRRQLRQHAGYELQGSEETYAGAFATAREALACAVAGLRALAAESGLSETGVLPVRMALHTGEAGFERGEYRGPAMEQVRRLVGAGHGGQILCSESTAALLRRAGPESIGAGLRLVELGIFRLHGSTTVEPLFQVEYPDMGDRQFALPRAEAGFTDNLPLPLTRFFGREAEIAQLQARLAPTAGRETAGGSPPASVRSLALETRLVTLTGAGGRGKTRLALEVARRSVAAYQGAVWFVSLADVVDPERILEAVRDALRLPRSLDVEPLEQIAAAVSHRPGLVLLDRFETLVGSGGAAVRRLLERVPSLRCLVTSRQRLDLAGEREFPLAPLPTPDAGVWAFGRSGVQEDSSRSGNPASLPPLSRSERMNDLTPERLMQSESVQLFVDRAQSVRPDFQVTKANAAAVASLCRHLEGIPLALELAAGRAQALTPSQMVAHLKRRFDFLVSRQRDADPRHRTLRAAIDSSYELLSPELQRFFARLSVFRRGWTLEAAAEICDLGGGGQGHQSPEVLDYLEQLRECSLIEIEEEEEGIRYRLLETLREYGWERLEEREETAVVLGRHRDWFLALAERLDAIAHGPEQRLLLGRLEAEHDNLRAALEWCRTEGDAENEVRLAGALWKFWVGHGHISEGRSWLEDALRRGGPSAAEERSPTPYRLRALLGAGALAFYQGEYATAAAHAARSEALARELEDSPGIALSLNILGSVEADRGLYDQATARFREGLALARTCADTFGVALALHNLGAAEEAEGRYDEANAALEASLNGFRELDDTWGMTLALGTLASIALRMGNHDRVRELCREVLDHSRRLGHAAGIARSLRYQGVVARHAGELVEAGRLLRESLAIQDTLGGQHIYAECLEEIAKVATHQGEGTRAARLFGAAAALRETLGVALQPADRPDYDRCLGTVSEQLSAGAYTTAWSEGHGMSLEQAVAYALGAGRAEQS